MSQFNQVYDGEVEMFIDQTAFDLISSPLPGWYLNVETKAIFREPAA